ncbi:MAG: chemotaxis protein CheW [Terracidiphilus sp.]
MASNTAITTSERQQASGQFSTFFIADLFFGVDVLEVQEVLRFQPMTAVPQAPDAVEGLINLRGQIVTAIDLRRRLQMPKLLADQPPMNIVISTPDGAVSLLVDEIGDVLDMDESTYERPPDNLDPAARELIRGVYKMKDGLLLVLDTERAVEVGSGLASMNSKVDSHSGEAIATGRRASSPDPDQSPAEEARSDQQQNSNGKGTRKVSAKKTNGSPRVARAGPV